MKVIKQTADLEQIIASYRKQNISVGFVPTMGALHAGHLSLIERARKENGVCVMSIFVNPIQFNNPVDLEKYPRTLEKDLSILDMCDVVFVPDEKEVYKEPVTEVYDFKGLDLVMEGSQRPGHFFGVAVIVGRLFRWIKPDRAYFGKKDFQQVVIIKKLFGKEVEIIDCPTVRENDGLALSSRNLRLSAHARTKAPLIYKILTKSIEINGIKAKKTFISTEIAKNKDFELEYFEIVDRQTLQTLNEDDKNPAVGCIVVWLDGVRLIDNIEY